MNRLIKKLYYNDNISDNRIENGRDHYIDNVKFILTLLVVVGHFAMKLTHIDFIKALVHFIYMFHMPCFVFISGFLAKGINAGGRLRSEKILQLFWMYLIFKVGNASLNFAFNKTLVFDLLHDTSAPWYLIALCIWYLLVPFIERIKTNYLIVGSFLIGLFAGYVRSVGPTLSLSKVLAFFPFFIMGFSLSERKLKEFLNKRIRIIAALFLMTLFILLLIFGDELSPFSQIIYGGASYKSALGKLSAYGLLIRGIWYLLAFLMSAAVLLLVPRSRLFFSAYGGRTMQIYITHVWCRNALAYAGLFVMLKDKPTSYSLLVLLGSVVLTFLLANRYLKKVFDLISGHGIIKKVIRYDLVQARNTTTQINKPMSG